MGWRNLSHAGREKERGGIIHGVWRHIPACLKPLRGTNMHPNYGGGDKSRMLTGKVLGAGDRVDTGGAGKGRAVIIK